MAGGPKPLLSLQEGLRAQFHTALLTADGVRRAAVAGAPGAPPGDLGAVRTEPELWSSHFEELMPFTPVRVLSHNLQEGSGDLKPEREVPGGSWGLQKLRGD